MINIKHRAIHKSIRRLGFEVLAELCMRNGKVIWLNQRQLWNICSNVVVHCLIVNSAQRVSFVTVCIMTQQQAEQLCRRVQSTSYQLKHWLLTIIVVYKHSCLASYISAAAPVGKHSLAANRPQSIAVRLRIYTSARVSSVLFWSSQSISCAQCVCSFREDIYII